MPVNLGFGHENFQYDTSSMMMSGQDDMPTG
jgi:hypothetical protein